jgi:hypothetical protein
MRSKSGYFYPRWVFPRGWLVVLAIAVALSAISAVVNHASAAQQPAASPPKITWSPERVEVNLPPGGRTGSNLSFVADQPFSEAVLWPVPGLSALLSVEPPAFLAVPANEPQSVRLEFAIPDSATPGSQYDGTVLLRADNRTLPQPLKVLVRVVEDDERPDPSVAIAASATLSCAAGASHVVKVDWGVNDAPGPVGMDIIVVPSAGPKQSMQYPAAQGSADFSLSLPVGGHALVLAKADTPVGSASNAAAVDLQPCFDIVTPAQGAGFGDGDLTVTPPGGDGELREVDIAHLGGTPQGTGAIVVMSVGSGAAYQLSSWSLDSTLLPNLTGMADPIRGRDVKLHVLESDVTPGLTVDMVVSAAVHNGDLWLTTWRVDPNGAFTRLNTRGFGANAGFIVQDFAIAHRPIKGETGAIQQSQVVTPVLGQIPGAGPDPVLRTVTWSIHPVTGVISGLHDSGSWGTPDADTGLTVAWQSGSTFVVAHRSGERLAVDHWTVTAPFGLPIHIGAGVSGLNLRGQDTEEITASEFAIAGLTSEGVVTAIRRGVSFLPRMLSWETRVVACDGGCYVRSHLIGHSDDDQTLGPGVNIGPPPALSDPDSITARGLLTDALRERFGVGSGQVMSVFPVAPQFVSVGIASVTKNMTLLVTDDAIKAGEVDLDEVVRISRAAATVAGNKIGLEEGERQTLRTLLHGMMLPSGNDASVAIAEHVGGTETAFVARMNWKAADLGLTDTSYNQSAGGGYSTPQDQVTLWLHAYQEPLFREIASVEQYDGCGEIGEGATLQPKCWFITKLSDFRYPGREGWKGGRGSLFPDPNLPGVPGCSPGRCLTAQATRMNRTMAVALQFSSDREGDAFNMWDYGFRNLFTPDQRGQAGGMIVKDFGVARVTDTLSVTGTIEADGTPQVCAWGHVVDFGQIERIHCTPISSFIGLPPGPPPRSVNGLEVEWLSSLLHEGDYLTAHVDPSNQLQFTLWRVGPKEP